MLNISGLTEGIVLDHIQHFPTHLGVSLPHSVQ